MKISYPPPAPWVWRINRATYSIELCGHGYTVMDFSRYGMRLAQPRFLCPDGLMHDAKEFATNKPGQEHNAAWNQTLSHPIADLIANAPAEAERLRGQANALRAALYACRHGHPDGDKMSPIAIRMADAALAATEDQK